MRIKILIMAVVLAGLLFSMSASAVTTDPSCGVLPVQQTRYDKITEVNKFDQTLGVLQSVHLTVEPCGYLSYALESTDESTIDFNINAAGNIVVTLPVVGNKQFQIGTDPDGVDFTAVPDGNNNDQTGTDYTKILIGSASSPVCEPASDYFFTGADMAPFIGNAGDKVGIPVSATSSSIVTGSANYHADALTYMGVTVCVEYDYLVPLCINGTKTNDCTDEPISGWEICLSNSSGQIDCIETDENGEYSFCGLAPGAYQVTEETRAGWTPKGATSIDVTLDEDSVEGVDFLNVPASCISGFKFNGTTEEGLSGWTINLKDAAGNVIQTKTTGADGSYEFCNLLPGTYTVSEVAQTKWTPIGATSITVNLECEDSENNIFRNRFTPPPTNPPCGPICPWFIKNELYTANCTEIKEVGADKGLLSNEMFSDVVVLNPEDISIDPKYGSIEVFEDGSFVYDPTGATGLRHGVYVMFKYAANNGLCDARYLGIAKIQVKCK